MSQPPDPTQGYGPPPPGYRPARPPFTLTLGDVIIIAGGVFIFFFSFAPFVKYTDDLARALPGDNWWSAWETQPLMAPLTWWVIFAGLLLIALACSRMFWAPQREFYGFKPSHLEIGLSLFAFFVLIGYALSDKQGQLEFGFGGIIMLLGSIAAVVGAVLNHLGIGPTIWPQASKPLNYPQAPPAPQG